MLFEKVVTVEPWFKKSRHQLSKQTLLVIGGSRIGSKVSEFMKHFMRVMTFDILNKKLSKLKFFIQQVNCVSIHIPKSDERISLIDAE
jgi:phosphoglycerate dehydrogenase-like enzyme